MSKRLPITYELIQTNNVSAISLTLGLDDATITVKASAQRHPDDSHNPEIGEALVLGRALQSLGRRLERRAIGMTKHIDDNKQRESRENHTNNGLELPQFEEGDIVEVIKPNTGLVMGTIGVVKSVITRGVDRAIADGLQLSVGNPPVTHLVKADWVKMVVPKHDVEETKEEKLSTFKIGDRVRILDPYKYMTIEVGNIGTVIEDRSPDSQRPIAVKVDDREHAIYYFPPKMLEVITP